MEENKLEICKMMQLRNGMNAFFAPFVRLCKTAFFKKTSVVSGMKAFLIPSVTL